MTDYQVMQMVSSDSIRRKKGFFCCQNQNHRHSGEQCLPNYCIGGRMPCIWTCICCCSCLHSCGISCLYLILLIKVLKLTQIQHCATYRPTDRQTDDRSTKHTSDEMKKLGHWSMKRTDGRNVYVVWFEGKFWCFWGNRHNKHWPPNNDAAPNQCLIACKRFIV